MLVIFSLDYTANVAQGKLDYVERLTYLRSVISSDGDVVVEINTRLAKAAAVF